MHVRPGFFWFVLFFASSVFISDTFAHGGTYSQPAQPKPNNSTPRNTGSPRGGGTTPGQAPTWTNWWEHNKEDFFDVRARRQAQSDLEASNEGYAADALHQPANPKDIRDVVIPVLVAALRDKATDVRDAACVAVGRAGSAPEAAAFQACLTDRVDSVREAALLGLGLLKHPIAEQMVIDHMLAPTTDAKERGVAAFALGLSGGKRAKDALTKNLGSSDPIAGVPALRVRQLEGCRAFGLGLIGDATAVADLLAAYKKASTREPNFLPMALQGLNLLRDPATGAFAISQLDDRKDEVKRAAAILAGRTIKAEDDKDVKRLIAFWDSESDLFAKNFTTISLGRIAGPLAVAKLKGIYETSKNREERCFAVLALGISKDMSIAKMLREEFMKEKDISLRSATAIALAILDDQEAAPLIHQQLAGAENPELQGYLVTALAMLEWKAALPEIKKLSSSARHPDLVRSCALALSLMQDSTSLELMITLLKNSGSTSVKGGMAGALGRIGDRRAIEPLIKIVNDASETDLTRAFAIVALGLIADKSPKSAFTRITIDVNYGLTNCEAQTVVIDIF